MSIPLRRRSGSLSRPGIAVGSAALAVLLPLAGACSGGGGTGGAKPSTSVGQPIQDGKFEFRVNTVSCGVTRVGDGVLARTPQGQYCVVNVSVKNTGSFAQVVDTISQKAFSSNGDSYRADVTASLASNGATSTFTRGINPGDQVTGNIVFDVPKSATLAKLELHDTAASNGVVVQVS